MAVGKKPCCMMFKYFCQSELTNLQYLYMTITRDRKSLSESKDALGKMTDMLEFQTFQFTKRNVAFFCYRKTRKIILPNLDVGVAYIVRYKCLGYSELGSHPSPPWVNSFVIPNDTFLSNSQQPTYTCNIYAK